MSCSATWPIISTWPESSSVEQRRSAGGGDLAYLRVAGEDDAVDGSDDSRQGELGAHHGELRSHDLDVGCVHDGGGLQLLDVLHGQAAGRPGGNTAPVFGGRQSGLRARLVEPGTQLRHLRRQHRVIELRENLTAPDMVAHLHVYRDDSVRCRPSCRSAARGALRWCR